MLIFALPGRGHCAPSAESDRQRTLCRCSAPYSPAMRLLALVLLLLAVVPRAAEAAFGAAPVTEKFDGVVSASFLQSSKKSYVLRTAGKKGKPLLVLLTKSGCGACQNLKQSVNMGTELKGLLKGGFTVVHAENAKAEEWMLPGQGYMPQTYFYAPGEKTPLPILGTSETSPHFFHDEATLVWGARKALEVVESGERHNSEGAEVRTDL